ncbi:MAG: cache domain-containing protein, partial [Pseudomonadota bacterium]
MNVDRAEHEADFEPKGKSHYSGLYRRFILLTMVCSIVPLLLVGWGINIHYTGDAKVRTMISFKTQLEHHRRIVEMFINERTSKLCIVAATHSRDYLVQKPNLKNVFNIMNRDDGSYTDLGIIDSHGRHLVYEGPYDLLQNNYSRTFWFREVMKKGIFVSDMFMGFRKVPHFIIAVLRSEHGQKWILRATIDTEVFRSLVEDVRIGKSGEVFLVNTQGVFQTSPKFSGKIMEKAPFHLEPFSESADAGILKYGIEEATGDRPRQIAAYSWLEAPRWMLMIRQDYSEALDAVNHANFMTLVFLHASAMIILIVAVFVTKHMISIVRKRDSAVDRLNAKFIQASKLASIGELSAGLAHEINNPLAIIVTEKQILLDMEKQAPIRDPEFKSRFSSSLSQIADQVQRCKRLTHNLLRFSRRTQSMIETVDINESIKEVVELMQREAGTSGIKILSDLDENLPAVLTDHSQLQQVFLNLITNAVDAHDGKPYGSIRVSTRPDDENRGVRIAFADTGSGIRPEI